MPLHAGLGGIVWQGAQTTSPLDDPLEDPLDAPLDELLAPELDAAGSVMSEPDAPEQATTSAIVAAKPIPAAAKSRFPISRA